MANEPKDIVVEARELLEYYKSRGMGEPVMVRQLCDEVERLRGLVRTMNLPRGD